MASHAKYSPSALHRILKCPGCVNACKDIPRKPANVHSMTGSIAHDLAACCLVRNEPAEKYIGYFGWYNAQNATGVQQINPGTLEGVSLVLEIDENMADNVQMYVNEINRIKYQAGGAIVKIEERLSLDWLVAGSGGTGDSVITQPLGTLYVDDYKNGFGLVEVVDNPQLMAYGLGALGKDNPHMVDYVNLGISQPNGMHPSGKKIRRHEMKVSELYEWGYDVLKPGIGLAMIGNPPLNAGDHCKYCDVRDMCTERRRKALTEADIMFDDAIVPVKRDEVVLPNVKHISGGELNRLMDVRQFVLDYFSDVHDEAYSRHELSKNDAPNEWKLVPGRKSRKFTDSESAKTLLSKALTVAEMHTEPKFKTVAQIEKALKKKKVDSSLIKNVIEITQGTSLVRASDCRDTKPSKVEQMFGKEKNDVIDLP